MSFIEVQKQSIGLAAVCLLAAACGSEGSPSDAAQGSSDMTGADASAELTADAPPGEYTLCEARTRLIDVGPPELVGTEVPMNEGYYFDVLTRDLGANGELQAKTGLSRVETCDQARAVTAAQDALLTALEGNPTLDGEERTVDKIDGAAWPLTTNTALMISTPTAGCTGVAINRAVILTAAHCIAGNSGGLVTAWAHQANVVGPGDVRPGTWTVRTMVPDLIPARPGPSDATFYVHPNYSGDGDYADDIGLIVLKVQMNLPSNNDVALIWDEATSKRDATSGYTFYGIGRLDGTTPAMWWANDKVDSWQAAHLSVKYSAAINEPRFCKGDSGGPLLHTDYSSRRVVAGVASVATLEEGTRCVAKDKYTRWTGTDAKASWIRGKITCSTFTGTNGWKYTDCR